MVPTTPTTPSSHIIYPHFHHSQHPLLHNLEGEGREERSSAGSGNLLDLADNLVEDHFKAGDRHDFLSQLDRQENQRGNSKLGGYVQFQDCISYDKSHSASGSSSSSGSSSDGEELSRIQGNIFQFDNSSSSERKGTADSGDILSGNLEATKISGRGAATLIEFGEEEEEEVITPRIVPTNTSSSYVDPFQKPPDTSSTPPSSNSQLGGVVFDLWGGLSPPDESNARKGGMSAPLAPTSTVVDILGLGQTGHTSTKSSTGSATVAMETGKSGTKSTSSYSSDVFGSYDPFGSFESSGSANRATTRSNHSSSSSSSSSSSRSGSRTSIKSTDQHLGNMDAGFDLMGDVPVLVPVMPMQPVAPHSSSQLPPPAPNTHTGNRSPAPQRHSKSNNLTDFDLLAPSNSSSSTPPGSVLQVSSNKQKPLISHSLLGPGLAPNVSYSHPDLSFGREQQQCYHNKAMLGGSSGNVAWNNRGSGSAGVQVGIGGSSSQNTSPRETPSPNPLTQSRSSENVSHGGGVQQPAQFDPFGQFNLKNLSGQGQSTARGKGVNAPSSSRPAVTVQQSSGLPPTGNSYQPYYMQSQPGTRVGVRSHSNSTSALSHAKASESQRQRSGAKPKQTSPSAFQARPHSPNYNSATFSTTGGNRTGEGVKVHLHVFSLVALHFNL